MNKLLFRIYTFLAIPFVLLVVLLNLIHPFIHFAEAGSLDLLLPWLDTVALSAGGGNLIAWARRKSHRSHQHENEHITHAI